MTTDLRRTQPLPAVETIADIERDDPERIFSHRRPATPKILTAREWPDAALERLLSDLEVSR